MPSREHFLLKRRSALSTDSFSPTFIVDISFSPLSALRALVAEFLNAYKLYQTQNNKSTHFCAILKIEIEGQNRLYAVYGNARNRGNEVQR